jgi:hypothetical protein
MTTIQFFQKIRSYADLTKEAEKAWLNLLNEKSIPKATTSSIRGKSPKRSPM